MLLPDYRIAYRWKPLQTCQVSYYLSLAYYATLERYNRTVLLGFYECDDESVKRLVGSPVRRSAYVLFYRRRHDFRPSLSNQLQLVSSDEGGDDVECHGGKGLEMADISPPVLVDDRIQQSTSGCDRAVGETRHSVQPSQYSISSDGRTSNGE